ncbi:MAG: hypothetical protein AAF743_09755 [Planctomycetota bacterium]
MPLSLGWLLLLNGVTAVVPAPDLIAVSYTGRLFHIDVANMTATPYAEVGAAPNSLAWCRDGLVTVIKDADGVTLVHIDPLTGAVRRSVPLVFADEGRVAGIDAATIATTQPATQPAEPPATQPAARFNHGVRALAFSEVHGLLAIVNVGSVHAEDEIHRIDPTTGVVRKLATLPHAGLQSLDFSPDDTLFTYDIGPNAKGGGGIVRVDPADLSTHPVEHPIHADIQSIATISKAQAIGITQEGKLFEIDLRLGTLTPLGEVASEARMDFRGLVVADPSEKLVER